MREIDETELHTLLEAMQSDFRDGHPLFLGQISDETILEARLFYDDVVIMRVMTDLKVETPERALDLRDAVIPERRESDVESFWLAEGEFCYYKALRIALLSAAIAIARRHGLREEV